MPYIKESEYRCSRIFKNGNISTIYSGIIKKTRKPKYNRMKLELDDGDFLLIDYELRNTKKVVILCHGLEGNSMSSYNNTAAEYFLENNFSVFAWNDRSCGGEMNLLPKLYHHGSFEDLEAVVKAILSRGFEEVYLLGFSLGGAQILSYFGSREIDLRVKAGVAVSTPIELKSSEEKIDSGFSRIYSRQLVRRLKKKIITKAKQFPALLDIESVNSIKSFGDIAKYFLLPVHKFNGIEDYFKRASPGPKLSDIKTPVLILNALDDPIIGSESFPVELAKENQFVYLETPQHGGHCAFPLPPFYYAYSEKRALKFFRKINPDKD